MNYVAMLCCVKRPASMSGVLGITGCLLSIPRIFMDFVHQQYHNLYSFTNAHIYIYTLSTVHVAGFLVKIV